MQAGFFIACESRVKGLHCLDPGERLEFHGIPFGYLKRWRIVAVRLPLPNLFGSVFRRR